MTHIIDPSENWVRMEELVNKHYLVGIRDELGTLSIFMRQVTAGSLVKLVYSPAYAFRSINETIRMGVVEELDKRYGTDFYRSCSLFKIENSSYLQWLSEQAGDLVLQLHLQHFVVMGRDYIVDVLAPYDPQIVKINSMN